jgi:hypothetical protein
MATPTFQKAVKTQAKLRFAIAGPSGSGKTFSSLRIATAMGGPIAVIDTEHGSASKYADLFDFDVLEIAPPYHPNKFINAIKAAEDAGYKIVIIDSLSHAWEGAGGVLEIKEEFAKQRSFNDYTAWKPAGDIHSRLINAMLESSIHVFATMRSKTAYSMDEVIEDGRKKTKVVKQGMAPIQRTGTEYEFDVMMTMDIQNCGAIEKTRCYLLRGQVYTDPGEELAEILVKWLADGAEAPEKPKAPEAPALTETEARSALWLKLKNHLVVYRGFSDDIKPSEAIDTLVEIGEDWSINIANEMRERNWTAALAMPLTDVE